MKWFIDKATKQYNVTIVAEEFLDFAQHYPASKVYSDNQFIVPTTNGVQ
ncbi:hypothetical protein [Mucilaginibacter gracilis]|nr:hypothetical protein [Mucilaginibacter gracilis]